MPSVAVTTTPDTAPRLAAPLLDRGLRPVLLPCVEVRPSPPDDLARLRAAAAEADWIVVTSPRAVRITWPEGGMPGGKVAAVGPSTARAVEEAGGLVEVVGDGGARRLLDVVSPRVGGRRVVFPHARAADPATAERLRAAGASLTAAPAYTTEPVSPGDARVDAALFGSPSAVIGWSRSRTLEGIVVAVMGATTAAEVRRHGREADVLPARPGFEPLVGALAEHLQERSIT